MRTVGPWSWSLEFSVFFCISSSPFFFLFSSFGFSFSNASLPSLSTHLRIVSHTMGTQATATTADQTSSQQDGTRRLTTVKSDESDERENGAPLGATNARTHARCSEHFFWRLDLCPVSFTSLLCLLLFFDVDSIWPSGSNREEGKAKV